MLAAVETQQMADNFKLIRLTPFGLTCSDYKNGHISVGSQDPANRNQDNNQARKSSRSSHSFFGTRDDQNVNKQT
jgi:hypothetical protein